MYKKTKGAQIILDNAEIHKTIQFFIVQLKIKIQWLEYYAIFLPLNTYHSQNFLLK